MPSSSMSRASEAPVWVLALAAPIVVGLAVLAGVRDGASPASATVTVGGNLAANAAAASAGATDAAKSAASAADPLLSPYDPEVKLGDRLFFETRFAQFFFANCGGDVNAPLAAGDPVMEEVHGDVRASLDSPFRGQSMNCRQCHIGDDFLHEEQLAGRTYCDFSRRSKIPARPDGLTRTERNSPLTINLGLARETPMLLHFDGEFATIEDLVVDTMTGRNFGWLPKEVPDAVAHIAKVVREDTGLNPRHVTYPDRRGVPYRVVMLGTDPSLPQGLRIPERYRLDVDAASDDDVVQAVARLIHAYMSSLRFGTTKTNRDSGSPYDLFLEKNGLPAGPNAGESDLAYAERLRGLIAKRERLEWVGEEDGEYELHEQPFEFGARELEGLKIFLARGGADAKTGAGNCVSCHTPPQFTDYDVHNNGVAQGQYDAVFGNGAFAALEIPDLETRNARFDEFLPASPKHPNASGRFRTAPVAAKPGHADLGVWSVYANPDMPKPQAALTKVLCGPGGVAEKRCTPEAVLPLTIAMFKTPSIRDLGQSDPYFHSGETTTIEDVLRFYVATSNLARAGKVRNASPELADVRIDANDVAPLAAFLRSLNEDYN